MSSAKLLTPGGGGVILQPASSIASDVTVNVPVSGVNGGTLVSTDASGNVGIGVTPSAWASLYKSFDVAKASSHYGFWDGSTSIAGLANGAFVNSSYSWAYAISGQAVARYAQEGDGVHKWFTAPPGTAGNAISFTQAMTLDSSGNLLVGTTSNPSGARTRIYAVAQWGMDNEINASSGSHIVFKNTNGIIGSISSSGSTTSYNTSSDYRLKENIQPMQNALDVVAQLNPVTYTWKADGSDGQGFIAHELQAVVPDCVTGEKDAVRIVDVLDDEGRKIGTKEEPVYQGVDTSFLVATLTAAIQEQQAMITQLQSRIEALENA